MTLSRYDAARIRKDVLEPLLDLADRVRRTANELDRAVESGEIRENWLPINEGGEFAGGKAGFKFLRKFVREELEGKLALVKEGHNIWPIAKRNIENRGAKPVKKRARPKKPPG